MRGDLSANGLGTIFGELDGDDANGALHLEGPRGQAKVFFREGDVYYASSPAPRAQLGARLIGAGFIDDEDLDRALAVQEQGPERTKLGAILVDQGMVRRDVIRVFVQEQILDAVFDLARWDDGEYEFFGGDAVAEDLPVQIPTGPLLMEVRRRLAEWDDIREVIPSLEAVPDFVRGGSTAQAALEPDEFTLLTSVDGQRSVRELAHDLGYSQFDAARLIYGLSLLGVIAVPNGEAPVAADERPAEGPEDIDVGRALEEALFGGGYDEELEEERPAQPAPQRDDLGTEIREPASRRPDETVAPEPEVPEPEAEVPEPELEPEVSEPEPEVARGSDDLEPEVWSASIDIDDDAAGTGGDAPALEPRDPGAAPEAEPEGAPEVEPDEAAEDAHDELLALMDELQSASDQVEGGVDEPPATEAPAAQPPGAGPPVRPVSGPRSPAPDEPGPEEAEPSAPPQEPAAPSDPGAGAAEERAERGDVSELLRELSRLADDGPEPVAPSPEGRTEPDGPSGDEPTPPSQEGETEQAPPEPDDRGDKDDKDDDKRSTFRRLFGSR